jgi:tight adherence protein B
VTSETFWLGRGVVFGTVLTVLFCLLAGFGTPESSGSVARRVYETELDHQLAFLRSTLRGRRVFTLQVALSIGCGAGALVLAEWPLALFLPAIAVGPKLLLERRVAERVSRLEEQIEPWLNAIANALKAGPSLGDAIASTTSLMQAPMSEEIDLLVKEYELGTPLDRALDNLTARVSSSTLSGAVLALKVARKTGGNLPEMLESAAAALRELARLEGVVRTKTAEGKAQAFVIGLIPAPLVLGVHAMDPHFFAPLAQSFLGNLVVAGAATLWAVAILMARKILAVDV